MLTGNKIKRMERTASVELAILNAARNVQIADGWTAGDRRGGDS